MRELWTLDPDLRYLNHGSFGAVPAVTQQAQRRLQSTAEANPMQWFRDLPARLVATRERIGDYLGVRGDELALVPNATAGVNVALRSIGPSAGERIVATSHAYGAVRLLLERVARERGCDVAIVPLATDATDDDVVGAIDEAVDERTACVVVDQITSATAKVLPADRIAALGRARDVPVVVDGAHAPALLDSPVVGDFWTGNLHKWPCAPRGTGVLYVAPQYQPSVVPGVVSWGDPAGFPSSFDYPGTTDATGWLATPSALDLLTSLGFADRRKELGQLVTDGAAQVAEAIGGTPVDVANPAATMRLVALPSGVVQDDEDAARLQAWLAPRSRVEVAVAAHDGHGFIRLSAHLYTTADDFSVAAGRYRELFADPSGMVRSHPGARG